MRKLHILVITALVLGLGVAAQAQNIFAEVEMFTTPEDYARDGGRKRGGRQHPGSILLPTALQLLVEGCDMIDAALLRSPCRQM